MGIKVDLKRLKTWHILAISITLILGVIIIGHATHSHSGDNIAGNNNTTKDNKTVNQTITYNVAKSNNGKEIRFIVVGDPHIKSSNSGSDRGNDRLKQIIKFVDSSNIDFVVLLGDVADDGKTKTYDIAKNIMSNSTKPYYTVAGNHDVVSGPGNFESHFGSIERIVNVKGYQLLFPGIYFEGTSKLHWSFDFNKTNKSLPTLVFMHGSTVKPPKDATTCSWGADFFGYGQSMQQELNKFPNLIAEYTGHVHYNTDQTINDVRYVTVNGLVNKAGGCDNEGASNYVGYSRVKDGKADYMLIDYNEPFVDPFPGK